MGKHIIISPFSKALKSGNPHAKNYPYWKELISMLQADGHTITQIGAGDEERLVDDCRFNLPFSELKELVKKYDLFISVDNFMAHFGYHYKFYGIVLWAQSNPEIFGYPEHLNLLKSKKYLLQHQFGIWEGVPFKKEAFIEPEIVALKVNSFPSRSLQFSS